MNKITETINSLCEQARQNSYEVYKGYSSGKGAIFGDDSRRIIENLLEAAIPILNQLKEISLHDYFESSQKVVTTGMTEAEKFLEMLVVIEKGYKTSFSSFIPPVWLLVLKIGVLPMNEAFKSDYYIPRRTLFKSRVLATGVKISDNINEMEDIANSDGKSGCYIATMAYGDYDHPQVIALRKFRDNFLEKFEFGRWFIKTYYKYSPILVNQLKDKKEINRFIRKILNQFIKFIN